jgi:hypothetical protein
MIAVVCLSVLSQAQPASTPPVEKKPYKILTNGRQVTIKSQKSIKNVMVWTATGHRVVEQKGINEPSFSFNVTVNERFFFVMVQLEGTKPYTEKIGIR